MKISKIELAKGLADFIIRKILFSLMVKISSDAKILGWKPRFLPAMSSLEYAFLFSMMRMNRDAIYFEYGSGGSTLLADKIFSKIYSSDSDHVWCEKINERIDNGRVKHVNIGGTQAWGYPTEAGEKEVRTLVSVHDLELEEASNRGDRLFVLIDGRSRVVTACHIFCYLGDHDILMIHDFIHRPDYYVLLELYNIKLVYGSLVFLVKKKIKCVDSIVQKISAEHSKDFR